MNQNTNPPKAGGRIARQVRQQLENQTGKSALSGENYLAPRAAKGVLEPSPRKKYAGIGRRGAGSAAIGVKKAGNQISAGISSY